VLTRVHARARARARACMHAGTSTLTYKCTCVCARARTCTCMHTHTRACTCTRARTCTRERVRASACVHTCTSRRARASLFFVVAQLTSVADLQRGTSFFGVGWCNAIERSLLGGGNHHEPDVGDVANHHFLHPCAFEVPNHVASPSPSQVLTVVPHVSITAGDAHGLGTSS
jgi:hypothetical protein